jgi:hypothetical protein
MSVVLEIGESRDSSVGIETGYRLDGKRDRILSPGRVKNFLFSTAPRLVLGPTQPPLQWVRDAPSSGVKRPGREITTHLQLVPTSRKRGSMYQLPIRLHGIVFN